MSRDEAAERFCNAVRMDSKLMGGGGRKSSRERASELHSAFWWHHPDSRLIHLVFPSSLPPHAPFSLFPTSPHFLFPSLCFSTHFPLLVAAWKRVLLSFHRPEWSARYYFPLITWPCFFLSPLRSTISEKNAFNQNHYFCRIKLRRTLARGRLVLNPGCPAFFFTSPPLPSQMEPQLSQPCLVASLCTGSLSSVPCPAAAGGTFEITSASPLLYTAAPEIQKRGRTCLSVP